MVQSLGGREPLTTTSVSSWIGGTPEYEKLCRARDQCREILKFVNEAVKQTENRHRLEGYQKRLDATALERASNPLAAEFKVGSRGHSTVSPFHTHFLGRILSGLESLGGRRFGRHTRLSLSPIPR